jgi:DNA polymerase alpha subunit B
VGRVIAEGDGRLNEASVLLEGSVKHSEGNRVRLELRDLPSFALFPGQVVAVEGANPSGFCLIARRLVTGLPGPRPERDAAAAGAGELSVVVAAGPFTCAGDLSYEPLGELLQYCLARRPDVLLLLGPFVDCEHALVSSGALDETFDALFDTRVRDALQEYADAAGPGCRVVLLPSTRDAHHAAVFPQPPLDAHRFEDTPAVLCAPNPAMLRCGGLSVGACAADVLRALSGAEAARGAPGPDGADRIARLAAHLPGQRSFFPLYPPPQGALLDATRAAGLDMPHAPHLLLLPSDLAPFAKVLRGGTAESAAPAPAPAPTGEEGGAPAADAPPPAEDAMEVTAAAPAPPAAPGDTATVCVNPGRLARGSLGGTFAHIHVAPGAGGPGVPLADNVRVDIICV